MSHNFLFNAIFHSVLNVIDRDLMDQAKKNRCPFCKNTLHQANYPRSPAGMPAEFRKHYDARLSLCCNVCRKRTTPPSVRFFGRRWYPMPLFIFICILQCGISERRLSQIKKHFGITVSESTWKRWRRWWRESFGETKFWIKEKGFLSTPLKQNQCLPRALFNLFKGNLVEKIHLLLKFLSPLTGGVFRAV
jgi:hypothetical protein